MATDTARAETADMATVDAGAGADAVVVVKLLTFKH